jgi:hypothetical protein
MPRLRHTVEQILAKLREADDLPGLNWSRVNVSLDPQPRRSPHASQIVHA